MGYDKDLMYIKTELARDGRSLEFLIDIIDEERAIESGESKQTYSELTQRLADERKRAKRFL